MTYRVLVTDEIDAEGVALLSAEPLIAVDEVPTLAKEELLARIGNYDAIVGRSATRISADVLEKLRNELFSPIKFLIVNTIDNDTGKKIIFHESFFQVQTKLNISFRNVP